MIAGGMVAVIIALRRGSTSTREISRSQSSSGGAQSLADECFFSGLQSRTLKRFDSPEESFERPRKLCPGKFPDPKRAIQRL